MLVRQSDAAIAAGAFHNDVVAVANERVLFTHEQAFDDPDSVHAFIKAHLSEAEIIIVPASEISLEDAVRSYLFNSQLVTLPGGEMALIVPGECREIAPVWMWLEKLLAGNGPIRHVEVVEVRESMRNGGGPACLRLRVAVSDRAMAAIDQRFLLDAAGCDRLQSVIERFWPEQIAPDDLGEPVLWDQCRGARAALLEALGFREGEL